MPPRAHAITGETIKSISSDVAHSDKCGSTGPATTHEPGIPGQTKRSCGVFGTRPVLRNRCQARFYTQAMPPICSLAEIRSGKASEGVTVLDDPRLRENMSPKKAAHVRLPLSTSYVADDTTYVCNSSRQPPSLSMPVIFLARVLQCTCMASPLSSCVPPTACPCASSSRLSCTSSTVPPTRSRSPDEIRYARPASSGVLQSTQEDTGIQRRHVRRDPRREKNLPRETPAPA